MVHQLQDALLRLPDVRRATGLSRASIYRMEALGQFPQRRAIGLRAVAWRQSDVQAWLQARETKCPA